MSSRIEYSVNDLVRTVEYSYTIVADVLVNRGNAFYRDVLFRRIYA